MNSLAWRSSQKLTPLAKLSPPTIAQVRCKFKWQGYEVMTGNACDRKNITFLASFLHIRAWKRHHTSTCTTIPLWWIDLPEWKASTMEKVFRLSVYGGIQFCGFVWNNFLRQWNRIIIIQLLTHINGILFNKWVSIPHSQVSIFTSSGVF